MKKKIRIVIYSRKSKFTGKGESVENQIELCKEYIQLHYPSDQYDVEIVIYEDEGYSGGNLDRPKFQEFLKEERKEPFDMLICYRLDRISRNIADFSNLINEITDLGTGFISIKEQFDTRTPMGRAMMYIASVFAQLEREVIAERVRDNMLELSKSGRWLGGPPPTGYRSEGYEILSVEEEVDPNTFERRKRKAFKLVPFEKEMKTIILIYSKFLEFKSLSKLESYLIQKNITSRKDNMYSRFALKQILSNPVYAINDLDMYEYFLNLGAGIFIEKEKFDGQFGISAYNKTIVNKRNKTNKLRDIKEWIISVGLHQGFIKGADWIKVQDILFANKDKRYGSKAKNEAILSGILRCSECGSYMRPKSSTGRYTEDGTNKYWYVCQLKEKSRGQRCTGKNINGNEADKLIVEKMNELFAPNSSVYKELKKMSLKKETDSEEKIKTLQSAYDKNNVEINNLIERIKYIDIKFMDMINKELDRLKSANDEIEKEISKLNNITNCKQDETNTAKLVLDVINNYFTIFNSFDLKSKRDLMKLLIESVDGNGDTITVNILNTKIGENKKKLFPFCNLNGEETVNKKSIVLSSGEQCKSTVARNKSICEHTNKFLPR